MKRFSLVGDNHTRFIVPVRKHCPKMATLAHQFVGGAGHFLHREAAGMASARTAFVEHRPDPTRDGVVDVGSDAATMLRLEWKRRADELSLTPLTSGRE